MEPPPRPDIDRWMGWEVAKLKFFGETFKISCDHKYIWVWPNNKKMYRAEGPGIYIYIYVCVYTHVFVHVGGLLLRNGCLFWQVLLKKDTQTLEAYHVKCQTSNRIKEGVSFDSESCKSCKVNKILGHGGFN